MSRTTFELLRGYSSDGTTRLFLKIFTQKTHVMIELSDEEFGDLAETLMGEPTTFDAHEFGE